jgi:CTP:phosphocholine cytidylyltransferase-like protein
MTIFRRDGASGLLAIVLAAVLASACSPTVKLEAPDKPITINLNVKIEQEVRVRVEKDIDDLVSKEPELFR